MNQGVYKYDYLFDTNIPSPAYTLGTITVASFGCLTCGTSIYSSHEAMFYVIFSYDLNLPSGSVLKIALPSLTNEFQSISYNCEAYSTGFLNYPTCTMITTLTLQIAGFGSYTQGSSISVYFRALSPPISSTTSSGSINVYYDSLGVDNIGTINALSFTVQGPNSVPTATGLIEFSKSSLTISTRSGDYSSFKFSFNPTTTLPKNTGTVTLKFLFTQASGSLLCKFVDRLNNYVEYLSSSCTVSGSVYTILAPVNTDITSGQI